MDHAKSFQTLEKITNEVETVPPVSHFLSLILGDLGQVGKQVNRVSPGVAWKTENQAYAPSEALGNPNGSKFVYQNALQCVALDQHVEEGCRLGVYGSCCDMYFELCFFLQQANIECVSYVRPNIHTSAIPTYHTCPNHCVLGVWLRLSTRMWLTYQGPNL